MPLTPIDLLILLGIAQGLLLAVLFMVSPFFRSRANRYLSVTLALVSLLGILNVIDAPASVNPWLIFCHDLMWEQLVPVTLLFYFALLLGRPEFPWSNRWLLLPFVFTFLINLVIDLDHEFALYSLGFEEENRWLQRYYALEEIVSIFFSCLMLGWSYRLILSAEKTAARKWAWEFWRWFVLLIGGWFLSWLFMLLTAQDYTRLLWGLVSIFFFAVTYRGVLQFRLMEQRFEIRSRQGALVSEAAPLPEVTTAPGSYLPALERLMEEERLYRDPALGRDEVAARLEISPGYLSRQLTGHRYGSFPEFVNGFRVREVQRLLRDPDFDCYSLLAIGYEAGFNSKSAFYRVFRKHVGMTPAAYRAQRVEVE